uniref:Anthranilate synthase component 1 n=1 Tax=candidate division WOR-3 bacterium TaxID=2052148 RepID=A0A7V3RHK1_UNCW3
MKNMLESRMVSKRYKFRISPVDAFFSLYSREPYAFLYESLEQGGITGRYSFIGADPKIIFRAKKGMIEIESPDIKRVEYGNPFNFLRRLIKSQTSPSYFAPFTGGAVGYISYDAIRYLEKIPDKNPEEIYIPDLYFIFPQELIIFDHKSNYACIILYKNDRDRLGHLIKTLDKEFSYLPSFHKRKLRFQSNFTKNEFCDIVKKAKEYIFAGDIFQVVLSQRFKVGIDTAEFDIYHALRLTNPSPYMYYLKLKDITILGSSPETLVKLKGNLAISRPLAGTRPRGQDEDKRLEKELLNDEKEKAEHIMLVDLARNDLGKVCEYGTVKPTALLKIERYSRVMHIVSNIIGRLRNDCDSIDLFTASFPAGTVSGAPKIRAMEIIDELETVKRNLYAGAIGYFDFNGNMDFCIGIRTILVKDGIAYFQGGAGIVADSIPENEYQETMNKTWALKCALEML